MKCHEDGPHWWRYHRLVAAFDVSKNPLARRGQQTQSNSIIMSACSGRVADWPATESWLQFDGVGHRHTSWHIASGTSHDGVSHDDPDMTLFYLFCSCSRCSTCLVLQSVNQANTPDTSSCVASQLSTAAETEMSSATQEVFPKLSGPCRETGDLRFCFSQLFVPSQKTTHPQTPEFDLPGRPSVFRTSPLLYLSCHLSISSLLEPYRAICPGSLVASPSICRDLNLVRSACLGRWENFEGYQTGCDPHGESASATKPGIAAQDFDCTQGPKWKLGLKKHRKHLVDALSEEKLFEIS